MAHRLEVRMPVLSDTMEAAEISEWHVEAGAAVRHGQPLASVVTDKVDMELESPYEGVIVELLAEPGESVAIGAAVATIETEQDELLGGLDFGDTGASDGAAGPVTQPAPPAPHRPEAGGRIVPATPPARKRARDQGIDLAEVRATGRRGQVTSQDVERHVAQRRPAPPATREGPAAERGTVPSAAGDRRLRLRRATAQRMAESARIPQFTLCRRVDLERAARHRGGRGWTTEIVRALAAALWRHPQLNAVWDEQDQRPVQLERVRIGVAVDTADGLVVVGLDDPDRVEADQADQRVREAVARAQRGDLRPDDTAGLSSTVSNLGPFAVDRFTALLMPPQATILSVGRIAETAVIVDGRVRPHLSAELGLTVDHRVADGAEAARLLDTLTDRLEG